MKTTSVKANLIDLFQRKIYPACITIQEGKIKSIEEIADWQEVYMLPGFIDAHVHIESSMLVPTEFAKMASVHGTVATLSDPHEIANVCGMEGVQFMIDNAKKTPFKIFFGAPSCVPATNFETSGATLNATNVKKLLASNDIWYLSEMMNYPGVINDDPEVMAKIKAAKELNKPIDGHAPNVRNASIRKYAEAGITTDHESTTLEEALEKISLGIHCLIREGSAAKNFEALIEVLKYHPSMVMFCSDDKHPDELVLHHINHHVKRALAKGYDLYDVLRAACVNPVLHYQIPVGLLSIGDAADFILINNLCDFDIISTYINGEIVAKDGEALLPSVPISSINNFNCHPFEPSNFKVFHKNHQTEIPVIVALDGQLITKKEMHPPKLDAATIISDVERDLLKLAVINRYNPQSQPAIAFIKNFGLKKGAIASTVAHDCHNIIVVGVDDESICAAVNSIIETKGGIAVAESPFNVINMGLPIAGLMSHKDGHTLAREYAAIDNAAKKLGSKLNAPFMTLSFMALLVIPEIKLSDKGLFDGDKFEFIV